MNTLPITALYAGLLGLLLLALAYWVVMQRARSEVELYDGGDERLGRAIRMHGNFIEYVPHALILMALVELNGAPGWLVHVFGLALLVARLLHAYGLHQSSGRTQGRFWGTLGTWTVIAVASLVAIGQFFL